MKFTDMLQHCWDVNQSLLCVGLDPDPKRFPKQFEGSKYAILDFCWDIVQSTGDLVCAFKPQIAYFASSGAEDQLKELIARIHSEYPEVPVILDAKRGDIGSTAKHYAKEAFERFGADCVTTLSNLTSSIRTKALSFFAALATKAEMTSRCLTEAAGLFTTLWRKKWSSGIRQDSLAS